MSTPIEIVREMQLWRRGEGKYADIREAGAFSAIAAMPYKPEQFGEAIDAVLADAERYKALERAVWIRVEVTRGDRSFTGRRPGASNEFSCQSLAELADTIKRVSQ